MRKLKGLRQAELAKNSGVSRQYISRVEEGLDVFKFGSEFARRLSEALGVPLSHWIRFTPDGPEFQELLGLSAK